MVRVVGFAAMFVLCAASCGRTPLSRSIDPRADATRPDGWDDAQDARDSGPDADAPDMDADDADVPPDADVPLDTDMPDVPPDADVPPDVPGCIDRDGDGYGVGPLCLGPDCNDLDRTVNPGAEEVCNDVDDNCDGDNDEGCPPDLIVDGVSILLGGEQVYDRVEILNRGRINVERAIASPTDDCRESAPGCLSIRARIIRIREDSGIDASGGGYCAHGLGWPAGAGEGLINAGAPGGGYGGEGGAGPGRDGGPTYGSEDEPVIHSGSPGRGFSIRTDQLDDVCGDLEWQFTDGGAGGGCIALRAPDIQIAGYLRTSGLGGQAASNGTEPAPVDGGAGGSGGGMLIEGTRISLADTASLVARGGRGGNGGRYAPLPGPDECIGHGGGGGGGGRIKILGNRTVNDGATISVDGGVGGTGPESSATPGERGTVFIR